MFFLTIKSYKNLDSAQILCQCLLHYYEIAFYEFQILLRACDNRGADQLCGTSTAVVNIIRDRFPPSFIRTPYIITINRNTPINTTVMTVTATDNDLKVVIFSLMCILAHSFLWGGVIFLSWSHVFHPFLYVNDTKHLIDGLHVF